jgi:hypothetical protein
MSGKDFNPIIYDKKKKQWGYKNEKEYEKKLYIKNLIYQIHDLSLYEANQLIGKLGNIYIEWNDE